MIGLHRPVILHATMFAGNAFSHKKKRYSFD
jgi:hypothetical protein